FKCAGGLGEQQEQDGSLKGEVKHQAGETLCEEAKSAKTQQEGTDNVSLAASAMRGNAGATTVENAEQRTQGSKAELHQPGAESAVSPPCAHVSNTRLRKRGKVECRFCQRRCSKYRFQCLD